MLGKNNQPLKCTCGFCDICYNRITARKYNLTLAKLRFKYKLNTPIAKLRYSQFEETRKKLCQCVTCRKFRRNTKNYRLRLANKPELPPIEEPKRKETCNCSFCKKVRLRNFRRSQR